MTTSALDRALQTFLGLSLVLAVAGAAFGLLFIGQDAGQSGEFLDGVGVMIGVAVLLLVGVPAVIAGLALRRSLRRQSHAHVLALVSGLVGLGSVAVFAVVYHPFAAAAVPLLMVTGLAVMALVEGR